MVIRLVAAHPAAMQGLEVLEAMGQLAVNGGTPVRQDPWPDWPVWDDTEEQGLLEVLRSGAWGRQYGKCTERFEEAFAALAGTRHCIATTTGTAALEIAYQAVGVGPGDEVIVPSYTFMATATAALTVFARPIFVDASPDTWSLDPQGVAAAITPKTKAIVPVHVAGNPCRMDEIMEIAREHGIAVVEDAAQAHAGSYKGRPLGSIGDVACFSFQASKNMNGGEGGAITTSDDAIAERCWRIHNCGRARDESIDAGSVFSTNERITEFQSAILLGQLSRVRDQADTRRQSAARLYEVLEDVEGVSGVHVPGDGSESAVHLFLVNYDPSAFGGLPKAKLLEALAAENTPAAPGYTPLHKLGMFSREGGSTSVAERDTGLTLDYSGVTLPVTERICGEGGFWIYQKSFMAGPDAVDGYAASFRKIQENISELL
jgi:dTDP-4-amino-4,6-dideoxygalactose transaminase